MMRRTCFLLVTLAALLLLLGRAVEAKKMTPAKAKRLAKLEADRALEQKLIEENKNNPVKSLSGSTFASLVGGEAAEGKARSKNYFVKFWAPWCGHCKKMEPEFREVGLAANEGGPLASSDLVIAQLNCDDFREVCVTSSIKGFPALKLYKKDGSVVAYEKKREKEPMLDFLSQELA